MELLERHGVLSYRLLRRMHDLAAAFTELPTFWHAVKVKCRHPFIRALSLVALRRTRIRQLKILCQIVADKWFDDLNRLRQAERCLSSFLVHSTDGLEQDDVAADPDMAEWMRLAVRRFFEPTVAEDEWADRVALVSTERELVDQINYAIVRAWGPAAQAGDGQAGNGQAGPDRTSRLWQRCLDAVQRFHGLPGDDGTLDTAAAERLAEVLWRCTFAVTQREGEQLKHHQIVRVFAKDMMAVQRGAAKGRTKWPKSAMFRFPVWDE